jgi:hypothetical protein
MRQELTDQVHNNSLEGKIQPKNCKKGKAQGEWRRALGKWQQTVGTKE